MHPKRQIGKAKRSLNTCESRRRRLHQEDFSRRFRCILKHPLEFSLLFFLIHPQLSWHPDCRFSDEVCFSSSVSHTGYYSAVLESLKVTMSRGADSHSYNGNLVQALSSLFPLPETIEKFVFNSGAHDAPEPKAMSSIPTDILDTPKEYIFYLDLPGLSKSDIQVTVEEENTLVIRSGGKRKREDGEEEGCKYLRLERKAPQKMMRKFKLPENADTSAISAKCESGELMVVVGKLPPPPKPKTVQVTIA